MSRSIQIRKTPRMFKYSIKMNTRIKEDGKKKYRRKWNKQTINKEIDK